MADRFLASVINPVRWAYRLTHDVLPSNTGFSDVEEAKQLAEAFLNSGRATPTREEASAIVRLAWLFVQAPGIGTLSELHAASRGRGLPANSPELYELLEIAVQFRAYIHIPGHWDAALSDALG